MNLENLLWENLVGYARPKQLSGERKNNGSLIARAPLYGSDAILFDEPASALDPQGNGPEKFLKAK